MSDTITFEDCCRLILEQGPPARPNDDPDKQDYRRNLLALLNQEFCIQWEDTDGLAPWDKRLPAITLTLVRHYKTITDPFSGWLEYAPVEGEMEVLTGSPALRWGCGGRPKARLPRALFRDLLLLRWPAAAHRTTSWTRLQELGLVVPNHDPDDFV